MLSLRTQTAAVVLLFVGSLIVLVYGQFATLSLPRQELLVRDQLQEAGRRISEAASDIQFPREGSPQSINTDLREISARVLADYPGIEGGFTDGVGWYGGFAFPTDPAGPGDGSRNEPPPLELPNIQKFAEQSLDKGEVILRTVDVGPSRVIVLVEPVGKRWPGRIAVWLLYRLTGPEQLGHQVRNYAISMTMSLVSVGVALVLAWNLSRRLRRQRRQQDALREELRRSEHLAGLGTMLAGVAHEVRNPLAAIRSTVQLWQRLPDSARTPSSLEAVVSAVDRLNSIVSQLLWFARTDNAQHEPVNVPQLMDESLDLIQAQAAEQGIAIARDFERGIPLVLCSPSGLRQVALNLLTNALQAMPKGGRLRCTVRRRTAGAIEVLVADTGPGIDPAQRKRLFEPFFTTRAEGTGLGLALCREIMTNHGGTIELVDTPDAGAVFRLELPVQERA